MLKVPEQISKPHVRRGVQLVETADVPIFRGGKRTLDALYNFINEIQEQRGNRLTEKQTKALIKVAEVLIFFVEAQKWPTTSDKDIREKHSMTLLRKTLAKYIPKSFHKRKRSLAMPFA